MAAKRTYTRHAGRPVGRPPRVPISPNEADRRRAEIEQKREYIESLKTGKSLQDGTMAMKVENIDINALEKQLERDERALNYLSAKEGTTVEKHKAQKDFDEAKEYISKHGLTLAEIGMYPKPDNPEKDADYGRAVEKSMANEVGNPEFQRMCAQLKCAAGKLDPDNPDLRNVNLCRQER